MSILTASVGESIHPAPGTTVESRPVTIPAHVLVLSHSTKSTGPALPPRPKHRALPRPHLVGGDGERPGASSAAGGRSSSTGQDGAGRRLRWRAVRRRVGRSVPNLALSTRRIRRKCSSVRPNNEGGEWRSRHRTQAVRRRRQPTRRLDRQISEERSPRGQTGPNDCTVRTGHRAALSR